ncbi:nuclear transport factor 2 family protein [soil metagenome]
MTEEIVKSERFIEDWASAELRGDASYLRSVLAEDFIGIGPRGFMLTKDEWLDRRETGKLRYEGFRFDEAQVRGYGETAVVTGRQFAEGKYEDYELRGQFRATLILVCQQERWLLAGIHLSPIVGPPGA